MAGEQADSKGGPPGTDGDLDAELGAAVKSDKARAYVVLFTGDHPGRIYPIRSNTVLIGRADSAEVSIVDGSVSLHHARILSRNQGFEIVDLDSTNGTFVSGKRVARSALRNADRVSVGSVDFMFLLDRPTAATIRLPDGFKRSQSRETPALVPTIAPRMVAAPSRQDDEEEGPSLADVIRKAARAYAFVRERALFIMALALVGALLGVLSLFVSPPGIAAVAEVKLMPHMTLSANPNEDPWQNSDRESGQFVKGAERAVTQPDLVRATLRKLTGKDPLDPMVFSVAGKIKVEESGDHTFRATYKDKATVQPSPREFMELHLRNYVQSEIDRSVRELSAKVDFLHNQLKAVEQDVGHIGGERASYREANADRLPEDAQETHSSRFELETRRAELSAQLHQLEGELTAEEGQLSTNRPEAQRKFQYSESYRQSLTEINRKLSEAYARGLGEDHPEVQALKDERERLQALAKNELQSTTSTLNRESDPNYQQAQSRVEKLRAQVAALRANLGETERSLGQVRRVVQDLPRVEQHLADLNHRQEATMQLHGDLFAKLKQAEIQLNLEKVSAESRYDVSPVSLERSRNRITLGLRAGLGLGLGIFAAAIGIALREARRVVAQTLGSPTLVTEVVSRRERPRDSRP
jgi:pSer/pThr/pTyr-binding forkhead associated (FHA) protein/prefoldin subunit 5